MTTIENEGTTLSGIYFGSVLGSEGLRGYATARLQPILSRAGDQRSMILEAALDASADLLAHLAPATDVHDPDGLVAATAAAAEASFPMLPGETRTSAELHLASGRQPVVKLLTNRAETYAVIAGARVVDGNLVLASSGAGADLLATPLALLGTIGQQVGSFLLSTLGSMAWSHIKKDVLGFSDVPSYFAEVFDRVAAIVADSAVKTELRTLSAQARDFHDYITRYNSYAKDELLSKAEEIAIKLKNRADQWPEALFIYADATTMDLLVMQERYKRATSADERASRRAEIADKALEYGRNIILKRDAHKKHRMAGISSEPYYSWKIRSGPLGRNVGGVSEGHHRYVSYVGQPYFLQDIPGGCGPSTMQWDDLHAPTQPWWWSHDWNLNAEINVGKGANYNAANGQLIAYRNAVDAQTDAYLKPLTNTAASLEQLSKTPVPS